MNGLLDFLQAASNSAAGTVSGPVDLIGMGLRKLGVPVPQNSLLSSEWMKQKGLMADTPQNAASLAGETFGLLSPVVAAAKAPQIARGLLAMGENAAAPSMLGKMGQRGGVDVKTYGIEHRPMTEEGGASRLHDLAASFGEDIYGPNALKFFGSGDAREREVLRALKAVRGKPDAMVTIYRGGPAEMSGINPGDWVTLSKSVAADYGDNVVAMKVPASDITSWADSLLEFGYYPTAKP